MFNLAVLVSGGGTTLENLWQHCADGRLKAKIAVIIQSNNKSDAVIESLPDVGITSVVHIPDGNSERVFTFCRGCDLVVSAGWAKLLVIPDKWKGKVINIHPSLLPKYGGKGMYGLHVHRAVLDAGEKVSGCTVHWMDDKYDHGPIIAQKEVPVLEGDTPESLQERVKAAERILYPQVLAQVVESADKIGGAIL